MQPSAIRATPILICRVSYQCHSFAEPVNVSFSDFTLVHSAQAKDKYEKTAVKFLDFEGKKYEQWMAATEHNLPMLMNKPLLVITSESQSQGEPVRIFLRLLTYTHQTQ